MFSLIQFNCVVLVFGVWVLLRGLGCCGVACFDACVCYYLV